MSIYIPYTARLPSAYQEVEYIQSSGTQYIRIGTQFKTNYKIVVDLQMDVIGGDYVPVGIRGIAGSIGIGYGINAWNGYFALVSGGSWTNTIAEDTKRHTITIDKSIATIDGNNYNISYAAYTYTAGLGVFCYAPVGEAPRNYSSNKLYKLDIYDENGTHIYDLVPCYRKSDSVIGLYDLVNDQFYTNSGTGTFSKGNDVYVNTLKNIYIGEYGWKPNANTIFYYEFNNNLNDSSGKGNNATGSSGVGYTTVGTENVITNTSTNSEYISVNPALWNTIGSGDFTISFMIYPTAQPSGGVMMFGIWYDYYYVTPRYPGPNIFFNPNGYDVSGDNISFRMGQDDSYRRGSTTTATSLIGGWHHIAMVRRNGVIYGYIDGIKEVEFNCTLSTTNADYGYIFSRNNSDQCWKTAGAKGDKYILESVGWTDEQVESYAQHTKLLYS